MSSTNLPSSTRVPRQQAHSLNYPPRDFHNSTVGVKFFGRSDYTNNLLLSAIWVARDCGVGRSNRSVHPIQLKTYTRFNKCVLPKGWPVFAALVPFGVDDTVTSYDSGTCSTTDGYRNAHPEWRTL